MCARASALGGSALKTIWGYLGTMDMNPWLSYGFLNFLNESAVKSFFPKRYATQV